MDHRANFWVIVSSSSSPALAVSSSACSRAISSAARIAGGAAQCGGRSCRTQRPGSSARFVARPPASSCHNGRRGSLSAHCSSRCAGSGISRRRWQISVRTDVFWDDACPRRSSFAGTGGGSGPDGVRSGHSGDGGRATRRGGQAGRPGQTAPLVEGLRARALEKMPGGCRFGRAASNQMDGAVRAGEEGGGADAHSDRPEGFSR